MGVARELFRLWATVVWRSYLIVVPLVAAFALGLLPPLIGVLVLAVSRYGVETLLEVLLLLIPALILVSLFPVLSPLIPIGLVIYWFSRKIRRNFAANKRHRTGSGAQHRRQRQSEMPRGVRHSLRSVRGGGLSNGCR